MVDILILFQADAEELATRIAWAAAERGYSVWGDPNHFAAASDEEIEAAVKSVKAVALLWSPGLVKEAEKRGGAFNQINPRRAAGAIVQPGLEPPAPWRDRPNVVLNQAAVDQTALEGFVGKLAKAAGAPSSDDGAAAVDRLRAAEEEAASWRAIRDLETPEVFAAYLERFGKGGLFASLARKRKAAARATRLAAGEEANASFSIENARAMGVWAGAGAAGAAVVFGLLTLAAGGDLRRLAGGPTEDAVALQTAAEYSADLDAELNQTREALSAAQEALEARNAAVAELEIKLAEARESGAAGSEAAASGGADGAANAEAATRIAAAEAQLASMTERYSGVEQELERKEAALAMAKRQLDQAEEEMAAMAAEHERAAGAADASPDGADRAALERELADARAETRRANRSMEAARLRIEALESELTVVREAAAKAREEAQSQIAASEAASEERTAAVEAPLDPAAAAAAAANATTATFDAAPQSAPMPRLRPDR